MPGVLGSQSRGNEFDRGRVVREPVWGLFGYTPHFGANFKEFDLPLNRHLGVFGPLDHDFDVYFEVRHRLDTFSG